MYFVKPVITNVARTNVLNAMNTSQHLIFTKLSLGTGKRAGDLAEVTSLVTPIMNTGVARHDEGANIRILSRVTNDDITTETHITEMGLFARVGTGTEFLFMYTCADQGDIIPPKVQGDYIRTYRFETTLSNEGEIIVGFDSSEIYVTHEEFSTHTNNKNNPHGVTIEQVGLVNATETVDGLMSKEDKFKLDTVELGANNYSHPNSHPASIITETSTKRFVTDSEKANWNSKTDDTSVNTHIAKKDNPHAVTKTQVGLANVDNLKQATKTEFNAHVGDSSHITTAERNSWNAKQGDLTAGANVTIAGGIISAIDTVYDDSNVQSHIASKVNPHTVTKTQVGLGNVSNVAQASKTEFDTHNSDTTKHITSSERNTWNAKASTSVATTSADGLMSSGDKSKLNGIATGANNYSHPATHPASMITESTTKRFVSDSEKSTWNGKQNALTAGSNVSISGNTISSTNTTYSAATTSANGLMSMSDKEKLDGIANFIQLNDYSFSWGSSMSSPNNFYIRLTSVGILQDISFDSLQFFVDLEPLGSISVPCTYISFWGTGTDVRYVVLRGYISGQWVYRLVKVGGVVGSSLVFSNPTDISSNTITSGTYSVMGIYRSLMEIEVIWGSSLK